MVFGVKVKLFERNFISGGLVYVSALIPEYIKLQ